MENNLIHAVVGGALIGIAAGAMLLLKGRVLGVSGIVSQSLVTPKESQWRISFLLGLVVAPIILSGVNIADLPLHIPTAIDQDIWRLLLGAVLVGLGTSMGSGCTSGHGVCGIGRLSVRSVVATTVFMLVAMVTVFVIRHLIA